MMREQVYADRRWRRLRRKVVRREPLCRSCSAEGRTMAADEVDHIIPLSEDSSEENAFGEDRVQPICRKCHREKTIREYHKVVAPAFHRVNMDGSVG